MQAVKYPYQPLSEDESDLSIRLLKIQPGNETDYIQCTLSDHILSHQHTCLSYTWGPENPTSVIYVDNNPVRVRQNLFNFLTVARRYKYSEPIWIDAVCINQDDESEKSSQVAGMAQIYSHAKYVVVWLGISEADCQALFGVQWLVKDNMQAAKTNNTRIADLLLALRSEYSWSQKTLLERTSFLSVDLQSTSTYLGYPDEFHSWIDHLRTTRVLDFLAEAPYWKRAWIVQELVLASRVVMLAPAGKLDLLPVISYFRQYIARNKPELHDTYFAHLPFEQFAEFRWRQKGHLNLDQSLLMGLNRECGDPRDRIFSILSLTRHGSHFGVDYSKDEDYLIWRAVWFAWTQRKIARQTEAPRIREHVLAIGTMVRNLFAAYHLRPTTSNLAEVNRTTRALFGYHEHVSEDQAESAQWMEDLFHNFEQAVERPMWTRTRERQQQVSHRKPYGPRCPFYLSLTFLFELETEHIIVEWPLIREAQLEPFGWTLDQHEVQWWTLDKSVAAKRPGHFLSQNTLSWLGRAQSKVSKWKPHKLE